MKKYICRLRQARHCPRKTPGVCFHPLNPTGKSYLLPRIIAYTAYCPVCLANQARKPNTHGTVNRNGNSPSQNHPAGYSAHGMRAGCPRARRQSRSEPVDNGNRTCKKLLHGRSIAEH